MDSSVWTRYQGDAAQVYERHLVPAMFEPLGRDLIEQSNPRPFDRVLDVACGTGILPRLVAGRLAAVVGLDINPSMLKMAHGLAKGIDWVQGSAISLPFGDESFDLVTCQQGLQFFPDQIQALKEINRVLAGSGRLVLSVWTSIRDSPGFEKVEQLLQDTFGNEASAIMRMPYRLADQSELHSLVRAGGFGDITMRESTKNVSFPSIQEFLFGFSKGSMLASYFSRISESEYARLLDSAKQELSAFVSEQGKISFPLKYRVVIARKARQ